MAWHGQWRWGVAAVFFLLIGVTGSVGLQASPAARRTALRRSPPARPPKATAFSHLEAVVKHAEGLLAKLAAARQPRSRARDAKQALEESVWAVKEALKTGGQVSESLARSGKVLPGWAKPGAAIDVRQPWFRPLARLLLRAARVAMRSAELASTTERQWAVMEERVLGAIEVFSRLPKPWSAEERRLAAEVPFWLEPAVVLTRVRFPPFQKVPQSGQRLFEEVRKDFVVVLRTAGNEVKRVLDELSTVVGLLSSTFARLAVMVESDTARFRLRVMEGLVYELAGSLLAGSRSLSWMRQWAYIVHAAFRDLTAKRTHEAAFLLTATQPLERASDAWLRLAVQRYRQATAGYPKASGPWANLVAHRIGFRGPNGVPIATYSRIPFRPGPLATRLGLFLAGGTGPGPNLLPLAVKAVPAAVTRPGTGASPTRTTPGRSGAPGAAASALSHWEKAYEQSQARYLVVNALRLGRSAEGLAKQGQLAEARRTLIEALVMAPDQPQLLVSLGRVQARLGDRAGALRTVQRLEESGSRHEAEAIRSQLGAADAGL